MGKSTDVESKVQFTVLSPPNTKSLKTVELMERMDSVCPAIHLGKLVICVQLGKAGLYIQISLNNGAADEPNPPITSMRSTPGKSSPAAAKRLSGGVTIRMSSESHVLIREFVCELTLPIRAISIRVNPNTVCSVKS